jgi:hypothetical protein
MFSIVFEKEHSFFFITNAYSEEEKPDAEVPELDEKGYFSNPHYDLEERHFNESERNFDEPDKHDYYERFDEKDYHEYR